MVAVLAAVGPAAGGEPTDNPGDDTAGWQPDEALTARFDRQWEEAKSVEIPDNLYFEWTFTSVNIRRGNGPSGEEQPLVEHVKLWWGEPHVWRKSADRPEERLVPTIDAGSSGEQGEAWSMSRRRLTVVSHDNPPELRDFKESLSDVPIRYRYWVTGVPATSSYAYQREGSVRRSKADTWAARMVSADGTKVRDFRGTIAPDGRLLVSSIRGQTSLTRYTGWRPDSSSPTGWVCGVHEVLNLPGETFNRRYEVERVEATTRQEVEGRARVPTLGGLDPVRGEDVFDAIDDFTTGKRTTQTPEGPTSEPMETGGKPAGGYAWLRTLGWVALGACVAGLVSLWVRRR